MVEYAGTGVDLCHENEKFIYGETIERNLDLFETFGSGLKGILDPSNYVQSGVKPIEAFKALDKYIKYLHIKDARFSDLRLFLPVMAMEI